MRNNDMTDHEARLLLDACMYFIGPEVRRKVMAEAPKAYNAYCGREIVKVILP